MEAEENNQFSYEHRTVPVESNTNQQTNNNDEDDEDEFQDTDNNEFESDKKNDTISSLAKKIQETKLNTSPPVAEPVAPVVPQPQPTSEPQTDKDDLDIDDIDLDNVDTTDVNLDDDLSD